MLKVASFTIKARARLLYGIYWGLWRIHHNSHESSTQPSQFVNRAEWQVQNGFHWILDTMMSCTCPPPPPIIYFFCLLTIACVVFTCRSAKIREWWSVAWHRWYTFTPTTSSRAGQTSLQSSNLAASDHEEKIVEQAFQTTGEDWID